jgi:hypothetical protein
VRDAGPIHGAAAGAVAVGLFVAGGVLVGDRPAFDAPATAVAADLSDSRTQVQLACALFAAMAPFFVWFLVTVASLARGAGPRAARAGAVALACGLVFIALFLVDVGALAVAALRPDPETAGMLRDLELLLMGVAAPVAAAVPAACAAIALRHGALWPRWLGMLAAGAAAVYLMRVGTLFSTSGAFAADGVLGFWLPVAAIATWLLVSSVALSRAPGPTPATSGSSA